MSRSFSAACVIVISSLLAATPVVAQARKPDARMAPIEDQPGLPRVLLIGDSISIGYTLPVRELLKGKANVHRIPANGGPTTNGVRNIDAWLGDGKWDVIHFNWGLHDLKYVNDKLQAVSPDKGRYQVSLADYEQNLEQLVTRMEKTGAKLIFCTTTPVPEGTDIRTAGDETKYNEVALKVMQRRHVRIDDLCAFALPRLAEIQKPADVHYTEEGSKVLAQQVAASIEGALAEKGK